MNLVRPHIRKLSLFDLARELTPGYFKVSEPTLVHLQLALPLFICLLDEVDTENIGVDVLPHFFDAVESPCHRVLDVKLAVKFHHIGVQQKDKRFVLEFRCDSR